METCSSTAIPITHSAISAATRFGAAKLVGAGGKAGAGGTFGGAVARARARAAAGA